ncbi:MAG: hypothetical protein IID44_28755 [Planctomycetes bacterium]|nr:hypothetical protein [Planctomycetota bacterium]
MQQTQCLDQPTLRFSPTAWAKLLYLRDRGQTEVGGFGIAAGDDLLRVEDVQLVRQVCTTVSVVFDDEAVADFFDRQVDEGRRPQQFGRIWIHTHPGDCPQPSMTDEETFARVFGRADWAVMFIVARGSQTYARLQLNVGPGATLVVPVCVDFERPFEASQVQSWEQEYGANVTASSSTRSAEESNEPGFVEPDLIDPFEPGTGWTDDAWQAYLDQDLDPLCERLSYEI